MICRQEIDLNKPYFMTVSSDAKDFIRCALNKDVEKRYSAKQLLEHDWMKKLSAKIDKKTDDMAKLEVF